MLDLILALLALAALSVPIVTSGHRVPALPLALQSLTALFGLFCLVLVLFRVLNFPGDAHGRELGLWVALAAVLGIVAGALVAMRDERRAPPGVIRISRVCRSSRRARSRATRPRIPRGDRDLRSAAAVGLGGVRRGVGAPVHDRVRLVQHAGR